jgi:hypothetical protein
MPNWIVKATWREDEADVSEQWEVHSHTAHDAVRMATTHMRFPPHSVEVHQRSSDVDDKVDETEFPTGGVRRVPPQ